MPKLHDCLGSNTHERNKTLNTLNDREVSTKSVYLAFRNGQLILPLENEKPASALAQFVHNQFRSLILDKHFACLAAQAALKQGAYRFGLYPEIGSHEATVELSEALHTFVLEQPSLGSGFTTFIASFVAPTATDEEHFERLLWLQLQRLHDMDHVCWDSLVSSDPQDPRFSFSFAGRAFFVVGLHSNSTRWTRRFAWPTLVFNAHKQFEQLRQKGLFERFQQKIRGRDQMLQGSINPNLANFGELTDARQYSGR